MDVDDIWAKKKYQKYNFYALEYTQQCKIEMQLDVKSHVGFSFDRGGRTCT